jgi:hypothetical protein
VAPNSALGSWARFLLCPPDKKEGLIMQRDRMRASLERLGIPPQDYRVLKLLPLIWVAWADGKMESVEKERIECLAMTQYNLSPAGLAVLRRWLGSPPPHQYLSEGLNDLFQLAKASDDGEVDRSELPALVSYAEAIARSSAFGVDEPGTVGSAEELALDEIARELHVDHGLSWARLLEDLH